MNALLSLGREARRSWAAWFGGGGAAGTGGSKLSGEPTRKRRAPDEWVREDGESPASPTRARRRGMDEREAERADGPKLSGEPTRNASRTQPPPDVRSGNVFPLREDECEWRGIGDLLSSSPDRTGYTTPDALPSTSPDRTGYTSVDDLLPSSPRHVGYTSVGHLLPSSPDRTAYASVGNLPYASVGEEDNWKCCIEKNGALTYVNDTARKQIRFPDEQQKVWELGFFQRKFLIKCEGRRPMTCYAPDFSGLTLAVLRILINDRRYRPDHYVFLNRHGALLSKVDEERLVSDVYIAGVDTEGLGSEANPIRVSIAATMRAKGSRGPSEGVEEGTCMLCCEPYHADSHRSQVVCSADDGCRTFAMCRLCVLRSSIVLQNTVEIDDEAGYEAVNYDATMCPQCRKKDAFQEDHLPALPQLVQAKVEAETYDLDLGGDEVPEGHRFRKGARVSKDFDGIAFCGWVVGGGWEGMRRTYKVLYSDGDGEVVHEDELAVIVVC